MDSANYRKFLSAAAVIGALLAAKYLMPLLLPFAVGLIVALAAEPVVSRMERGIPRSIAAGIGVTGVLLLLGGILSMAGTAAVRAVGQQALPEIEKTAAEGITLLEDRMISLAQAAPDSMRPQLTQAVLELFGGGGALITKALDALPGLAKGLLTTLPDGALGFATGLLSAYLISARLPRIRAYRPAGWERYRPALLTLRRTLGQWFRAQCLLTLVTFGICLAGFLILGVEHGFLLALLVALVDAAPVLGTGTVLIPWALISLLRRQYALALGLCGVYAAASLSRTVLEPKFLGNQLGLDPLIALGALYLGFRTWGIPGMILAPLFAAAVREIMALKTGDSPLDKGKIPD